MSSTPSQTLTHETATIRPAREEQTHFAKMAALYAWIFVTLAIFVLAAMLAGMEDRSVAAQDGLPDNQVVGAVHQPTR